MAHDLAFLLRVARAPVARIVAPLFLALAVVLPTGLARGQPVSAAAAPAEGSPEPLRISVIQRSGTQEVAARMLEAVYARAGIPVRMVALPAARASLMSSRGEIDGEAARIPAYYAERPELVVVEPALLWTDSVVYMRRAKARPVVGVADLRGLRVGVVRGVRQSLMAVAGAERVDEVTDAQQLYRMLGADRLDAVVDSAVSRRRHTRELGLEDVVEVGILSRMPVHHALHRRHAALAPRVSATLAAMQASGELSLLEELAEREASRPRNLARAE